MFIARTLLSLASLLAAAPTLAGVLVSTVDASPGFVGAYNSLQLNGANPVISYQDATNQDLKLATCTANCATATPAWQVVTVDSAGSTGYYTSLQLNGGNPVIAYHDGTNGAIKLATCTANCATATPTWQIVTVHSGQAEHISLRLNGGNPVISFYDLATGSLKLATCTAACATASPAWQVVTVDGVGGVGKASSLQLDGGKPVISYVDVIYNRLKLATCTAACTTASPTWEIVVVDTNLPIDAGTSLYANGGSVIVSYRTLESLRMAFCTADCATSAPTWRLVDVERGAGLGRSVSLRLGGDARPVVSYSDETTGDLKRATCMDGCYSGDTSWQIVVLAGEPNFGRHNSMSADGSFVSFEDFTDGDLKLAVAVAPFDAPITFEPARRLRIVDGTPGAGNRPSMRQFRGRPVVLHAGATGLEMDTCVTNCFTAAPEWVRTTVDAAANGSVSSLQLYGDQPIASYTVNGKLVVATCTENCKTASPTWVTTAVEAAGVGDHSLGLENGTPVVAYTLGGNVVKYARCASDCRTAAATWIRSTIHTGTDVRHLQLSLYGNRPDASFSDSSKLTLATCTGGCDTAAPTWAVVSVDASAVVAGPHSLDNTNSLPRLAYRDDQGADLKVATCRDCATASRTWYYDTVDSTGDVGSGPSLLSYGTGINIVSYYDATRSKLKLAICQDACLSSPNTYRYATIDTGDGAGASTVMQLHERVPIIAYSGGGALKLAILAMGPALAEVSTDFIDFGYVPLGSASPARAITVANAGGETIVFAKFTTSGAVVRGGSDCARLLPLESCTVQVYVKLAPPPNSELNSSYFAGGDLGLYGVDYGPFLRTLKVIAVQAIAEKSLVGHYYQSILRRPPDNDGYLFWRAETLRVVGLGASVNETWYAMAQAFYSSSEYAAFGRNNTAFATDLYNTFFNRPPDDAGLSYWAGNLDQGMPREVALAAFMFSAEFASFSTAIFGNTAARAEVNAVVDFYRGLLARIPDDIGFAFWRDRFRAAQCQGPGQVVAEVEAISSAFALSGEYLARNRTNAQYVGDLYNAFLRRGGDLGGVQFWIGQLNSGAQTREQLRVAFRNSAEFQARVQAIIAQGCSQ